MATCVPIKEMKNTSSFTKLVESSIEPIIVTKNGYEAFAVMTIAQLDALRLEAARAKLYRLVDEAEDDFAAGRTSDAIKSQHRAREIYDL